MDGGDAVAMSVDNNVDDNPSDSNGNGNGDEDNRDRRPRLTDVLLPGADYVLDHWTVGMGSAVRLGETVAIARRRGDGDELTDGTLIAEQEAAATNAIVTAAAASSSSAVPPTHKRPNRRRRPGGPGGDTGLQQRLQEQLANKPISGRAAAAALALDGPRPSSASTSASTGFSLKDRLAAKLSSKREEASGGEASGTSSSKIPSTISIDASQNVGSTTTTTTSSDPTLPPMSSSSSSSSPSSSHDATTIRQPKKELVPIYAPVAGLLRTNMVNPQSALPVDQSNLAIGCIEECLHPTYLDGMCVVCGTPMPKAKTIIGGTSWATSSVASPSVADADGSDDDGLRFINDWPLSQVTVSGGITMTVSKTEGRRMALLDSERLFRQRRLALVLDLDHTLVHATSDPRAGQYLLQHHNRRDVATIRLPLLEGAPGPGQGPAGAAIDPSHLNMWTQHHIKLRPHINAFLTAVQPRYEVTVYTAGTRSYAEEVTMVLCRSMVGAPLQWDALERLRYQVRVAESEYAKHKGLMLQEVKEESRNDGVNPNRTRPNQSTNDDDKDGRKRKAGTGAVAVAVASTDDDEMVDDGDPSAGTGEPSRKRKKVSFGFQELPPDNGDDEEEIGTQHQQQQQHRSDHMTGEELERMRAELRDAERLEQRAAELRQQLFGSRVVSRTDVGDLGRDVKSLRRIFPCGGTMAAVVDDREDVWANAKDNTKGTARGEPPDNLLLVRPYHWQPFIGLADVNNAAGVDLSGLGHGDDSEGEDDEQLLWTRDILERLHQRYYQHCEELYRPTIPKDFFKQSVDGDRRTVPDTLRDMRKEVLQGSTLVLSGLVPLHQQGPGSTSARPAIVRYAQTLGAKIKDKVEDGVTHVVAAKDGTDKAIAAKKVPGCVLVKPAWLMESYWSMTKRNVGPFLMGWGPPRDGPNSEPPTRDNTSNDSGSNDSDEDDFAAELEDEFMNDD